MSSPPRVLFSPCVPRGGPPGRNPDSDAAGGSTALPQVQRGRRGPPRFQVRVMSHPRSQLAPRLVRPTPGRDLLAVGRLSDAFQTFRFQVQFPRPTSSRTTVTDVNVCPTFVRCSSRKGACRVQPAVTRTFLPRSRWGRVAHSVEIRSFCHFLQSHTAKSHLHLQLRFPPTFSPTMLKEWYTTASAAGTAPLVGHCPRAGRAIPSQMEI